jgi:hypothetical protein
VHKLPSAARRSLERTLVFGIDETPLSGYNKTAEVDKIEAVWGCDCGAVQDMEMKKQI